MVHRCGLCRRLLPKPAPRGRPRLWCSDYCRRTGGDLNSALDRLRGMHHRAAVAAADEAAGLPAMPSVEQWRNQAERLSDWITDRFAEEAMYEE